MKKMFIYYFKKRLHIMLAITIILAIISWISFISNSYVYKTSDGGIYPNNSPIPMLAFFAAALATIIPLFEFHFKMRKISIDQMYSLPIKREKLYLVKYLVGFVEIMIPMLIVFLLNLLFINLKENIFDIKYLFIFFGAMIPTILALYTTICFIYTRNNTFFDGLIILLLYIFLFFMLAGYIVEFLKNESIFGNLEITYGTSSYFFIYSPITCLSRITDNLTRLRNSSYQVYDLISFIFFGILGVISFILFIKLNKEDKSENSMQESNSYFSYRTIIPIYSIVLSAYFAIIHSGQAYFFIAVLTYLGYCIYHRNFKLNKKQALTLIIILAISFILTLINGNL